jgi:acyl carrier protein
MSTTSTTERIEKVIVDALAGFGPDVDAVTPEATFEELEIDSLDLVELAQVIEDEFGVKLDGSDVAGLKTVGEVIALVASRAA